MRPNQPIQHGTLLVDSNVCISQSQNNISTSTAEEQQWELFHEDQHEKGKEEDRFAAEERQVESKTFVFKTWNMSLYLYNVYIYILD